MTNIINNVKIIIEYLFIHLLKLFPKSEFEKAHDLWVKDDGDYFLRLFYDDLDETSIVFDIGGYKGQWASDIFAIYQCRIFIFEPVRNFAEEIKHRFSKNPKIIVNAFGLSNISSRTQIYVQNDRSSIFMQKGSNSEEITLIDAISYLESNQILSIDLIKINIEGAEYDLLDHLIDSGYIKNIKNIQVQFHSFIPHAEERMTGVQNRLKKTHALTYQYKFIWENWRLIE